MSWLSRKLSKDFTFTSKNSQTSWSHSLCLNLSRCLALVLAGLCQPSFPSICGLGMNESAETIFLLTSIVRVIAAAGVSASLHCHLSAELRHKGTSQTRNEVEIQNGRMKRYTINNCGKDLVVRLIGCLKTPHTKKVESVSKCYFWWVALHNAVTKSCSVTPLPKANMLTKNSLLGIIN